MRSQLRYLIVVASAVSLLVPSLALSSPGRANESTAKRKCTQTTKVNFLLNWVPDYMASPYFEALDRGWYASECLKLKIIPGSGSTAAVQQVANGTVNIGVADIISVVAAQAKGIPVTAVGAFMQRNPASIIIRTDRLPPSEQANPTPPLTVLNGKTYGQVVGSSQSILWQALTKLGSSGIDAGSINTVGVTPPGFAELVAGKVDFITNWFVQPVLEDVMKLDVTVIPLAKYAQLGYGMVFIANNGWLRKNAVNMRAFLTATKRAMIADETDPGRAVGYLCKHAPTACSTSEARKVTTEQYRAVVATFKSADKKRPYLCIKANKWVETQVALAAGGIPSNGPGPEKAFTSKYLTGC